MKLYQLAEEFRKNYMTNRLRPSTMRGYNINLNRHILPCLGKVNVSALNVNHLDELTEHLKQKNLCNRSVVYAHATLRKMLSYALRRGYIRKTPYDVYDLPKVQKYKYTTLNTDQVRYILEHVSGDLRLPVVLALKYGMRRGEVLGLKWSDIDVVQSTVHVQRTRGVENGTEVITPCKTESGNRFSCWHRTTFTACLTAPLPRAIWCGTARSCWIRRSRLILRQTTCPGSASTTSGTRMSS